MVGGTSVLVGMDLPFTMALYSSWRGVIHSLAESTYAVAAKEVTCGFWNSPQVRFPPSPTPIARFAGTWRFSRARMAPRTPSSLQDQKSQFVTFGCAVMTVDMTFSEPFSVPS